MEKKITISAAAEVAAAERLLSSTPLEEGALDTLCYLPSLLVFVSSYHPRSFIS